MPAVAPGGTFEQVFKTSGLPLERIVVEVVRGTGFAALSAQVAVKSE
jgi:hypothetical protein